MPGKKKKKKTEVVKDCVDPKYEWWFSSPCLSYEIADTMRSLTSILTLTSFLSTASRWVKNYWTKIKKFFSVLGRGQERSFLQVSGPWNHNDLLGQPRTSWRDRRLVPPGGWRGGLRIGFSGPRFLPLTSGLLLFPSYLRALPGRLHLLAAQEKNLNSVHFHLMLPFIHAADRLSKTKGPTKEDISKESFQHTHNIINPAFQCLKFLQKKLLNHNTFLSSYESCA